MSARRALVGDIKRQEAEEGAHRERRDCDAERAADDREQHAVGEKLAADAAARRAQGEARADLSPARRAAGEEQAGDVQAGEPKQNGSSPQRASRAAATRLRRNGERPCGAGVTCQGRREIAPMSFGSDDGKARTARVLLQPRLEPGLKAGLRLRRR